MEIQALLLSNMFPKDIAYEIHNKLCMNKNILTALQKDSIIFDHFHLKKIIRSYFRNTLFGKNPNHDDYFMYWLENDMLNVLNDDKPYIDGLSINLRAECPELTKEYLLSSPAWEQLPQKIYCLWKSMTDEKKMKMYQFIL